MPTVSISGRLVEYEVTTNGCHVVTSHKPQENGYVRLGGGSGRGKSRVLAHRGRYEDVYGALPDDILVRHTCDNRPCVNIDHLLSGTPLDNSNDAVERNRNAKGERAGTAVLTEPQARAIKYSKRSQRALASEFGVSRSTVKLIKEGKTWKHL